MRQLLPEYLTHLEAHGMAPLTVASYRQRIGIFLAWMGGRPLTLRLMQEYRDHLQLERVGREGAGCRPRTIRVHLAALGSFWKYCSSRGYRDLPPLAEVKKPRLDKERAVWVNESQADKLVAAAARVGLEASDPAYREFLRWRAEMIVTLALALGLRRSDIKALRKADYILTETGARLRIRKSKGGETRTIPVPEFVRRKIREWLRVRDARCKKFKQDPGSLMIDRGCRAMGDYSVDTALRQVVELAGLEASGITPHSLRHGCATYLLRLGVDIETVREILGHANIATTYRYVHTDYNAMEAAMERLGKRLGRDRSLPTERDQKQVRGKRPGVARRSPKRPPRKPGRL